jgi:hypothetical protein
MEVKKGVTEEWLAVSPMGRVDSSFDDEVLARSYLEARPTFRLFRRETTTTELER